MTIEMVSVTIEGVQVTVPKGTSIIEAAKQAGVLVPHYCYHPSLPSPAVCRMCLVEIEKFPKLVPSCVTPIADGQVIHVHSPAAKKAREGVLEFLLINHPLDCPVCDQAGECELQDFVFQEGQAASRYGDYPKRYSPVEDFGPDILYVANRCILCTRCVRFMGNVAGEKVLNVSERGDRAYIGIDPSALLDHDWAGNVVDLCPVGSLVSKDFLHKARAWDLDKTASICPGCTQGCNIMVDTRDDAVVRLRPRANLEVNRHFICDTGRSDYRWMNRGDRVEAPMAHDGIRYHATDWPSALEGLAALVRNVDGPVVLLAGGRASVESLGAAMQLLEGHRVTAAMKVPLGPSAPIGTIPNLALRAERAANLGGAELLGIGRDFAAAVAAVAGAALVVVLDVELDDAEAASVASAAAVVHLTTVADARLGPAALVLPITSMVEEQGVYVNRDGRAQRYLPARPAPGMAWPAWRVCWEAWALNTPEREAPATASEAFGALAPFAGMTHRDLGLTGRVVTGAGVTA
ncbi:MAG: (2Fe-2S)-binding protein [Gemmatimonadales bacterium]|nr:(2Fe-2S)-binding protein [Gemmatimonadales bacterium]MBP6570217.1 (2Fe-2S)-binding protein [Gemmatimonadales bacterium]MBP7619669.1 (2Fe-2S)-binding protein [Gemmatimonadales bacterium]